MKIIKQIFSPWYTMSVHKRTKQIHKELREQNIHQNLTLNLYKNIFLTSDKTGINKLEKRSKKVTVSLTTYSYRVKDVYLTIESLLNQSVPADRIILWLAEDEYNINTIPATLKKQITRGLEVKFCKDIKSYKKLIPTIKECPDDIIITTDDDIMYPIDFIEGLYQAYLNDSTKIYCYRARLMPTDQSKLFNYDYWPNTQIDEASTNIVPIGMGGVLYTADKFNKDILNEELFMSLAPKADDIWFKAMSLLTNTKCQLLKDHRSFDSKFVEVPNTQGIALCNTNLKENGNNAQIKAVFEKFNLKDF